MTRFHALRTGRVVLTAPLWVGGSRLRQLLADAADVADAFEAPDAVDAVDAADAGPHPYREVHPGRYTRSARLGCRLLSVLARLPFSPWRNTCLYRSVVVCRCLRLEGLDARMRLGVRRGSGGCDIAAHAWVEVPSDPEAPLESEDAEQQSFAVLRSGPGPG